MYRSRQRRSTSARDDTRRSRTTARSTVVSGPADTKTRRSHRPTSSGRRGGADDVAALSAQDVCQLVGEGGLAGGGWSVDRDPRRVRGGEGPDRAGQLAEELAAGALIH